MSRHHQALILVTVDLVSGRARLKRVLEHLQQIGKVASLSSVYKRYLNHRSEDLNSELVMALRLETSLDLPGLFANLKAQQEKLILLGFNREVRLYPGENLPHPQLHSETLTLCCAAEAWGSYEHPVLGQTLNEIVKSNDTLVRVEFFAQGKSLFEESP